MLSMLQSGSATFYVYVYLSPNKFNDYHSYLLAVLQNELG